MLCRGDTSLTAVLNRHAEVFKEELGSMNDVTVKLYIKPDSTLKFLKARPVPYAIRPKVEAELERPECWNLSARVTGPPKLCLSYKNMSL